MQTGRTTWTGAWSESNRKDIEPAILLKPITFRMPFRHFSLNGGVVHKLFAVIKSAFGISAVVPACSQFSGLSDFDECVSAWLSIKILQKTQMNRRFQFRLDEGFVPALAVTRAGSGLAGN